MSFLPKRLESSHFFEHLAGLSTLTQWTPYILKTQKSQSPFLHPMAHRVVPVSSISVALGHMSVNAVKARVGGWSTGSSVSLTFPLHSHM